jgi:hypothetical protein
MERRWSDPAKPRQHPGDSDSNGCLDKELSINFGRCISEFATRGDGSNRNDTCNETSSMRDKCGIHDKLKGYTRRVRTPYMAIRAQVHPPSFDEWGM